MDVGAREAEQRKGDVFEGSAGGRACDHMPEFMDCHHGIPRADEHNGCDPAEYRAGCLFLFGDCELPRRGHLLSESDDDIAGAIGFSDVAKHDVIVAGFIDGPACEGREVLVEIVVIGGEDGVVFLGIGRVGRAA